MKSLQVSPPFGVGPESSARHIPNDASTLVTLLIASNLSLVLCIYSKAEDLRLQKEFMNRTVLYCTVLYCNDPGWEEPLHPVTTRGH
jgi:hypothetical protein